MTLLRNKSNLWVMQLFVELALDWEVPGSNPAPQNFFQGNLSFKTLFDVGALKMGY